MYRDDKVIIKAMMGSCRYHFEIFVWPKSAGSKAPQAGRLPALGIPTSNVLISLHARAPFADTQMRRDHGLTSIKIMCKLLWPFRQGSFSALSAWVWHALGLLSGPMGYPLHMQAFLNNIVPSPGLYPKVQESCSECLFMLMLPLYMHRTYTYTES